MTKFCFIALLMMALVSCNKNKNVTVGIHVNGDMGGAKPVLVTSDSTYEVVLDSAGSAVISVAATAKPGYATFSFGRVGVPLYISDKDFDLTLTLAERKVTPEFTGEGAKINTYLNGNPFKELGFPDFKLGEEEFVASLAERLKAVTANLDTMGLDPKFTELEKQRLNYVVYSALPNYPSYHGYYAKDESFEVSPAFYNQLKNLIVEDEALMNMMEYKAALPSFIQAYSTKDIKEYNPLEMVKAQVNYVDQNIKSPVIASYLIDNFASGYVKRNGIDNLPEFSAIYNAKVTDAKAKAKFEELCAKWSAIAKGQPSPAFKYMDINGKEVSLADLAGKYVFVDVWATWCGPCRGELPALKELEHKYKGKNIEFVSISCDQNKEAWEKMVKEEKLGGVQLHNGGDQSFMETYMITGIPRFILLDKEGKIVTANMSRPSNPATVATLDALEGI